MRAKSIVQINTLVITCLTGLALAGSASANSISLVWTATSGAGAISPSGNTIANVSVGDTVTLDIVFNASAAGVTFVGLDVVYIPILTADLATAKECPSPPALIPGFCSFSPVMTPLQPGVIQLSATKVGLFDANTLTTGGVQVPFTLGRISFTASGVGSGQIGVDDSFEGIFDGNFMRITVPVTNASISVVPEPATAALTALGLGALAWARRRRSAPVRAGR